MLVCGIDIGSTNLKVAFYRDTDRPVWLRSIETPRTRDAIGPVTNAAALVQQLEAMIVQGWQELGAPEAIAAISTSGVGEDGVYVDTALEPLGPALPWFDLRALDDARELAAHAAATPRSGIAMDPTRTAAKWLWSARNLNAQVKAAHLWIALTDYPLARWSNSAFMSDTLASRTGCYDVAARDWIAPLLAASRAPALPQVVPAGTVIGYCQGVALRQSGAANDRTLLVAGGHDHPIAAHAIHHLAANARVDSMGTANVIYGDTTAFVPEHFDPLISFMASVAGPEKLACLGVFEFTAAVQSFAGGMTAIRRMLDQPRLPGEPGLIAEKNFANERQVLEWATMNARLMLEQLNAYGVPEGPIFATGGWSRSRGLLELRASIFGQPVHAPAEKELSVLGAALLAAKAARGQVDLKTEVTVIEPCEDWRIAYDDIFAQFVSRT